MKLYNLSFVIISSMSVILPFALAKKEMPTCKAVFKFPELKDDKKPGCQRPEVSSILAAQGLAYEFASGTFIDFTVANRDDKDSIERHPPSELAGYYDEFFVVGRPRGQGIDERHLMEEGSSSNTLDHSQRLLGVSCQCCATCSGGEFFCSYSCGGSDPDDCSECRRRNLRSNEFEQNHRGLITMQESDPNLCTINPITLSTAFTDMVNTYFKINCIMERDYLMYLGSTYYYITVDDKTGQQIGIKHMGEWN